MNPISHNELVALFQFPVFSETKIGETKVLVYKSFVVFFQERGTLNRTFK